MIYIFLLKKNSFVQAEKSASEMKGKVTIQAIRKGFKKKKGK